jgi:hypothetical protein
MNQIPGPRCIRPFRMLVPQSLDWISNETISSDHALLFVSGSQTTRILRVGREGAAQVGLAARNRRFSPNV